MNLNIDWMSMGEASVAIGGVLVLARVLIAFSFPTRKEHRALIETVDDMRGRFQTIETQIAALPTQSEIETLNERLGRVETGVAHMSGTLDRVAANVSQLIENELRERR